MRCFEIYTDPLDGEMYVLLNNNMRCFEIVVLASLEMH